MADAEPTRCRPGRPLVGYRDVGEDVRHSRAARDPRVGHPRGARSLFYLAWTLIVYFLEPGLR